MVENLALCFRNCEDECLETVFSTTIEKKTVSLNNKNSPSEITSDLNDCDCKIGSKLYVEYDASEKFILSSFLLQSSTFSLETYFCDRLTE